MFIPMVELNKMNSNLTFLSLNVRGLRDKVKRRNVLEWCNLKGSNIIFLQETYSTPEVEEHWKLDWRGPMIFSHGTNHSKGVLVLITQNIGFKIEQTVVDGEGRYIFLKGEVQGVKVLLCNVYFPTKDKERLQVEFLVKLDKVMFDLEVRDHVILLGGDFNTIMNCELDYLGLNTVFKVKVRDLLVNFLSKYDLIDIWRKRNAQERQFTFRQKWPVVQSRLDYWFISSKLEKLVCVSDMLISITPDHSGIRIKFRHMVDKLCYGKSYWKFNNSLCLDKEFVEGMKSEILNLDEKWRPQIGNKVVFWDFIKMKMREYIIRYSSGKAKKEEKN